MSNKKPVSKAYSINFDAIEEGYLYDHNSYRVFAETNSEARSKLLSLLKENYEDLTLRFTGEQVTYLNIPVRRSVNSDLFDFDGEVMTVFSFQEKKSELERKSNLDKLLNDPEIEYCYIRKGSYYGPNWSGYTDRVEEAGVYLKKEAVSHAKNVRKITLIPIVIKEHNALINAKIEKLKSKIL